MPAGRGAAAFHQGEPAAHFVLLHGCLKVTQVTPDGEQVLVRYVNPGDLFGLARAMRQACYPASVVAVQESVCLAWPAAAWDEFAASHPRLNAAALQTMGRLQDAHLRIQELSTDEVEQRVARAMLRLFEQSGQPVADGIGIGFPITRQDIAELTGTTLHGQPAAQRLEAARHRRLRPRGAALAGGAGAAVVGGAGRAATARAACPVSMDRRRTVRRGRGARAAGLIRRCFRVAGPGGGGE